MDELLLVKVLLGLACLGLFIFFLIFIKNKKRDKKNLDMEFSYEKGGKTYIKDVDKEYILLNLDEFKEKIGNGKVFYIESFLKNKIHMNGGAFLGGFLWLGYRGLILEYFIFLGIYTLIDVLILYFDISIPQNILGIVTSVTLGISGNYLYFLKIKNRIEKKKKGISPFLGVAIIIISFAIYLYLYSYYIEYLN